MDGWNIILSLLGTWPIFRGDLLYIVLREGIGLCNTLVIIWPAKARSQTGGIVTYSNFQALSVGQLEKTSSNWIIFQRIFGEKTK